VFLKVFRQVMFHGTTNGVYDLLKQLLVDSHFVQINNPILPKRFAESLAQWIDT
jgi:hypothetical protein